MRELERFVILQVVDVRWREHLENMDYLREGVHLRSMAQKDPLVEYTGEGERMFTELGRAIRSEVVLHLFHAELAPEEAQQLAQAQTTNGNLQYEHETLAGAEAIAPRAPAARRRSSAGRRPQQAVQASPHEKIGRNDPCWCGSGKKFKGATAPYGVDSRAGAELGKRCQAAAAVGARHRDVYHRGA